MPEHAQHPLFAKAKRPKFAPDTFMGFSLEKEAWRPEITEYYRPASIPEAKWFGMSPQSRLQEFQKHFANPFDAYLRNYDRIAADLGTDAIHAHITFMMLVGYPSKKFAAFSSWYKHVNDHFYFKGLENGRFSSHLIQPVSRKATPGVYAPGFSGVPADLQDLDVRSFKNANVGLRTKIYGGDVAGYKILGLEPRDITHDPVEFKWNVRRMAESVQDESWASAVGLPPSFEYEIVEPAQIARVFRDAGFDEQVIPQFSRWNLQIPLAKFEAGTYFDYRAGRALSPTADQVRRIVRARKNFLSRLRSYAAPGKRLFGLAPSKPPRPLDKTTAQQLLTEWAQEARISELFLNY